MAVGNKGVFYGRYSSKMQTENSIEGQRRAVENYANREGIEIIREYIDREKSGKTDKREQFQAMIADIENGDISVNFVIVWKLDRFARNEKMHRKYEDKLNDRGVFIISATESVNEDILASRIVKSVSIITNEEEVRKISENVSRGKKEVAYKCQWCGGTPPLGYDVDSATKKLIINPNEAKIVRYAFRLRCVGFSYQYIINQLNLKGYKTKRGGEFKKNSLFEIFRNIKYKGCTNITEQRQNLKKVRSIAMPISLSRILFKFPMVVREL